VGAQQQLVAREALADQQRELQKRAEPLEAEGPERLTTPQTLRGESAVAL
jgi:hypothetical protein